MLDFMRRNARSWGIKAALGIISLVFVFFMGGGGQLGAGPKALATVGDIEISRVEFDMARRRNENYFRQEFQGQVTDEILRSLDIPSMTLNQLIDGAVLRAEAGRLGLAVTDDAMRATLMRIPAFQANGAFSPSRYQETLRSQGLTPGSFEQNVRDDMLEAQLADIIRRGSHVTEEEAWLNWQRANRRMNLSYVALDAEARESEVATDEEALAAFYETRKEQYRRPPSVKVRYLAYRVVDLAARTEVSDVDLNEYYEMNRNAEFLREEQVGARHILKKVAEGADEAEKKAVRDKIEAIAARLAAGESFEEVAKAESEDPGSAEKGGDLGRFGRGRMVPEFEAAAFTLEPGAVSGVVESDFGYHLIQVYEKTPAGVAPFDEVKDSIRTTLAMRKATDQAFDLSAEDAARITDGATLDAIAAERALTIEETPPLSDSPIVPGIGPAPAFIEAAFDLTTAGQVSQPVKVGADYFLLSLVERKESEIPPLAEVRDSVQKQLRAEKALELARARADELLEAVKGGRSLADVAADNGLTVQKAEDVGGAANVVPGIGPLPGLSEVAMGTARDGAPLPRSFVSGSKAYIFVRDSVVEPSRDDFDVVKDEEVDKLAKGREQEALAEFIRALKEKEKITYDVAQLRPLLGDRSPFVD